jgi:hypothetical protein
MKRWKGDRLYLVSAGDFEGDAVAGGEKLLLIPVPALPHRSDGMDDVCRRQAVALRDLRAARRAPAQRAALGPKVRPGSIVDGTIDTPAATKRTIGRVDDGVYL